MTVPCIAASTGKGRSSMALKSRRYSSSFGGPENSPMSAPEKNVLPSQINIAAFRPEPEAIALTASARPARTAAVMVLTGGLLTATTAMSPSYATVTMGAVI